MNFAKRFKMPKWTEEERAKADAIYGTPKSTETKELEIKTPEASVETPAIAAEVVETPQIVTKPENVIVVPDPAPVKKERKPRAPRQPKDELRIPKTVAEMMGQTFNGLTVLSLNEEHTLLHTCGSRAVNVRCECGREFFANPYYVKGLQTRCECKKRQKKVKEEKKEELVAA